MLSFSFFSLYFINTFPRCTIPIDYPPSPSSSHSPHFHTLYLLPAIEHYPLELTFCTVPLVIAFGFRIRALIQLPFYTPTPASLLHSQFYPQPGRHPQHQPLPPSSHSTSSGYVKGPMSEGVL